MGFRRGLSPPWGSAGGQGGPWGWGSGGDGGLGVLHRVERQKGSAAGLKYRYIWGGRMAFVFNPQGRGKLLEKSMEGGRWGGGGRVAQARALHGEEAGEINTRGPRGWILEGISEGWRSLERVGRNVVGSSLGGMWDWGGALGSCPVLHVGEFSRGKLPSPARRLQESPNPRPPGWSEPGAPHGF